MDWSGLDRDFDQGWYCIALSLIRLGLAWIELYWTVLDCFGLHCIDWTKLN